MAIRGAIRARGAGRSRREGRVTSERGTPDREPSAPPRPSPDSCPTPGPSRSGTPAAARSRRVPLSTSTAAWALCAVTLLLLAAHVVALYQQRAVSDQPWGYRAATVMGYAGIPVVGALIISRVPRHPSGW